MTAGAANGTVRPTGDGGLQMSVKRHLFIIAALGAMLLALPQSPAHAANWLEKNFWLSGPRYSGKLPACDEPMALAKIASRFGAKEHKFWNSPLTIVNFDAIRETGNRPWAPDTIPRRFCSGRALISDGVWRPVHYLIGEDFGMIGATWGVEWCVVGLDRNWANNPACRMMRP